MLYHPTDGSADLANLDLGTPEMSEKVIVRTDVPPGQPMWAERICNPQPAPTRYTAYLHLRSVQDINR
jgi:hypothetical protein